MEAALQVIMEQLKELSAGQSVLKSEINTTTAELKMDMCAIGTRQEALNSDVCKGKV
jgi:hypothetical protein